MPSRTVATGGSRDVIIVAIQSIHCAITTDTGIAEAQAHFWIARVEEVLHILRVEALMRDRATDEDDTVAILQTEARRLRCRFDWLTVNGRGEPCGEDKQWDDETTYY